MTRLFLFLSSLILGLFLWGQPAQANVDPYVRQFLRVSEPISLSANSQGEAQAFSPEQITQGKKLFEQHCANCHVGGSTLPDPLVSLSLGDLQAATPPRDNIQSLVTFLRQPMTHDGTEPSLWCREVPESWLSNPEVENLAAFVLRAAQIAPGWGQERF